MYFSTYKKNLEHLEHLSNIRNVLAAEKEAKNLGILGIAASVLAIYQVLPPLLDLILMGDMATPWWERILSYEITSGVTLVFLIFLFRGKLKNLRKKIKLFRK